MLTAQADLFYRFGAALLIGLLIGLERERSSELRDLRIFAGVRTIALMALAGCVGGLLSDITGSPWPLVAVILSLGSLIVSAYVQTRGGGSTSEVAAFVALLCGALAYYEYYSVAAAIGVVVITLLSFKQEMHNVAHSISREDVYSTLKFAAISAIVLPILPDQAFGPPPFDALNPYRIWLMVVFISAISFMGYVTMKLANPRNGIALTGLFGGLVSSTAVTLSFGRRSKDQPAHAVQFATAITAAWAVMFLRVMVQVGALNLELLNVLWLALAAGALVLALYAGYLYRRHHTEDQQEVSLENPFELRPALTFGAIYALILLVSRTAQIYFGDIGIYLSSIIAGFADVNAVTLSMADLSGENGDLALGVAAQAVILAVLSNTVVRSIMVYATGSGKLRRYMLPSALLAIIVTVSVALWLRSTTGS